MTRAPETASLSFLADTRGGLSERAVLMLCIVIVAVAWYALADTELGQSIGRTIGGWIDGVMSMILRR